MNKDLPGNVKIPDDTCLGQLRIQPTTPNDPPAANPSACIVPGKPRLLHNASGHPADRLIWSKLTFTDPHRGSPVRPGGDQP